MNIFGKMMGTCYLSSTYIIGGIYGYGLGRFIYYDDMELIDNRLDKLAKACFWTFTTLIGILTGPLTVTTSLFEHYGLVERGSLGRVVRYIIGFI